MLVVIMISTDGERHFYLTPREILLSFMQPNKEIFFSEKGKSVHRSKNTAAVHTECLHVTFVAK